MISVSATVNVNADVCAFASGTAAATASVTKGELK